MGVRTIGDYENAAMYCSTTDWAFGPVFSNDEDGHDAIERIELFCSWLVVDPRSISESELESKYSEFRSKEKELWIAKELADMDEDDDDDQP